MAWPQHGPAKRVSIKQQWGGLLVGPKGLGHFHNGMCGHRRAPGKRARARARCAARRALGRGHMCSGGGGCHPGSPHGPGEGREVTCPREGRGLLTVPAAAVAHPEGFLLQESKAT